MFGNENDRPYEFNVNQASSSTMAYVIGKLSDKINVPFGVNVLWDPISTIALAVSTNAKFVREIFTGTYASDMGIWSPNAGKAMRYRNSLNREKIYKCFIIYLLNLLIHWTEEQFQKEQKVLFFLLFQMQF